MRRNKRGSSYIFVIVMVVFLVVLATGFYYMSSYNVVSTVENRTDTQGEILSRSLHSALCKKAADGKMNVMNQLVKKGKEDYKAYLEELEAYREDDEEGDVPEEPDPESEYQAQSDWIEVMLDNSLYEEAWMKSEVTCKPFKGTAVITTHVKYKVTDVDGKTNEYSYDLASDMTYGKQMEVVTKDPIFVGGGEGGTPGYAVGITNGNINFGYNGTFEWGGGPETEDMHVIYGKEFTVPWDVPFKSSMYATGDVNVYGPVGVVTDNQIDCPGNIYCVGGNIAGTSVSWIAGDVYAKSKDGEGGNIQLTNGLTIYGGVYADGDITSDIQSADCLWAGGSITLEYRENRFQSVEAVGDININHLIVEKEVNSPVPDEHSGHVISRNGSIDIGKDSSCKVAGSVMAEQNITISNGSVAGDVISTSGNVVLYNCNVDGNVYGKNVSFMGTVTIGGDVVAEGTVDTIQWPATVMVSGDISCASLNLISNQISLKGTVLVAGDASINGSFQLEQSVSVAGRLSFGSKVSLLGAVEINVRSTAGQNPDKGPGITINEDPGLSVTLPEIDRTIQETAPIPECPVEAPADTTGQIADFSAFEEVQCSFSGIGDSPGSPVELNIEAPVGKNVVYNLPNKYIKLNKISVPEGQIVYLNLDAMGSNTLFMPSNNGNNNKILGTLILYSTKDVTIKFNGTGNRVMKAQIYVPNGSVIVGGSNWPQPKLELTGTITAKELSIINGASLVMIPQPESFGNTRLGGSGGGGGGGGTSYPFPSVGVVPSGGNGWGVTRLYRPEAGQEDAG